MRLLDKADYDNFMDKFSSSLSRNFPDVCFYIYGSYLEGTCDYGRSDIDGGLIVDSNFITDKTQVLGLARSFSEFCPRELELNFNLNDRGTNRDGRFLSYTTDYTNWLKKQGKVVCGPDYVSEMNGLDFKSGNLNSAAFNFRRTRNNFLESFYDLKNNPLKLGEKMDKSLQGLKSLPKKLIALRTGNVVNSFSRNLKDIENLLPGLDLSVFNWAGDLFKNSEQYGGFLNDSENIQSYYLPILNGIESMLFEYTKKFPEVSYLEASGQIPII